MVVLDGSVRLVSLQFSFSNPDVVPLAVIDLERETLEEREVRKDRATGVLVIESVENISLVEFLNDLEAGGYEMVKAFTKPRLDKNDRTYHMVHFLFARHEYAQISKGFKKVRNIIRTELREICEQAMWRVRVFLNPFYKNGEETQGKQAVSINLEVRKPLFRPDGQPITIWQKDERGRRVGDAPFPLKPDHYLRIKDNTVQVVTA